MYVSTFITNAILKGDFFMSNVHKRFILLLFTLSGMLFTSWSVQGESITKDEQSIIVEVTGDSLAHKNYIAEYYPAVEVESLYHTLFNGLALQAQSKQLEKVISLDFIKAVHAVETYRAHSLEKSRPLDTLHHFEKLYPHAV